MELIESFLKRDIVFGVIAMTTAQKIAYVCDLFRLDKDAAKVWTKLFAESFANHSDVDFLDVDKLALQLLLRLYKAIRTAF